jgi:F-type H+-transporting ATPase subunit gamma
MPEQPKVIRKRIRSVDSTQKITRTMEMVATAKLKAAQDRVASSGPYLDNLRRIMADIGASDVDVSAWPQFEVRDGKRTLVFVVTANRGLCGGFNTNLVRLARNTVDAKLAAGHAVRLVVAGKKGISALRFAGYTPDKTFTDELLDIPTVDEADFFLHELAQPFLDHEVDEVLVVYPHWENATNQPPTVLRLFPIAPETTSETTSTRAPIFQPSPEVILDRLLTLYQRQLMFSVLAETIAGEQFARRMAMKLASDNASEMVHDLKLQYNKARQALITQELAEIIGGVEALKN